MGSSTSILGSIKHTLHAALESVSPTIRIHWRSLELMQQYCYRRPKQNCKIYKIISRVWYTVSQQDAIDTTKKKNSYSRIVLVVRILLHQNNNTKSADYGNEVIFCGLLTTIKTKEAEERETSAVTKKICRPQCIKDFWIITFFMLLELNKIQTYWAYINVTFERGSEM